MIKKYKKRPIVVEAVQVAAGCHDDMVKHFGEDVGSKYGYILGTQHPYAMPMQGLFSATDIDGFQMWIKTLEGTMSADIGDYIIKGIQGEFYPCKPDIFEATYEQVNNENE